MFPLIPIKNNVKVSPHLPYLCYLVFTALLLFFKPKSFKNEDLIQLKK